MAPQRSERTFGYIDSASITQVVQAFHVHPELSSPNGWEIPLFVTSLLISTDSIGLAPGISPPAVRSRGLVGEVTRDLLRKCLASKRAPARSRKEAALDYVKGECRAKAHEFKTKFDEVLHQATGWLEWSLRYASVEHFQNFGTLIDAQLIPELSLILDMPEDDVKRLHVETSRSENVEAFARTGRETLLRSEITRCFLLAALLRGMYHDRLARGRYQVAHHDLRASFLSELPTHPLIFGEPETTKYLASIVVWDALTETSPANRLSHWVNDIAEIRKMNEAGDEGIDIRPKEDPAKCLRDAVVAAQRVGIRVVPRALENFLPKIFGVGIGVAIGAKLGVALTPYLDVVSAGLTGIVTGEVVEAKVEDVGKGLVQKLYGNRWRLRMLAEAPPGRLSAHRARLPV